MTIRVVCGDIFGIFKDPLNFQPLMDHIQPYSINPFLLKMGPSY